MLVVRAWAQALTSLGLSFLLHKASWVVGRITSPCNTIKRVKYLENLARGSDDREASVQLSVSVVSQRAVGPRRASLLTISPLALAVPRMC